jgi:hypothetical protein
MREWDEQAIAKFLNDRTVAKGSKKLIDLAHELHTHYSKTVHGPLIAAQMDLDLVADIRGALRPFVLGETAGTGPVPV